MLQSRFSRLCLRIPVIHSGTISKVRLTISEVGQIRLLLILPLLTIWSLQMQNTDTLLKISVVSVQAASEQAPDIIHLQRTVIPAVYVRVFYVQIVAVSVWVEIVYLVADMIKTFRWFQSVNNFYVRLI